MGLNVSANTEHVFGFKNENFAHTCANAVDLESFMDNGDKLNNIFLLKRKDEEIKELHQDSQVKKDDMVEMCRVNREGYGSHTEIYKGNHQKLAEALNEVELVWLTTEQHLMEAKINLECCLCKGPSNTMSDRILKERDFKDAVVRTCFGRKDARLYQERTSRSLGPLKTRRIT